MSETKRALLLHLVPGPQTLCSQQCNKQIHVYCILGQLSLLRSAGKRERHIQSQRGLRTARRRAIYITSGHSKVYQMEQSLCQPGRAHRSFFLLTPGSGPAELWASRPQLPVYEAKAVSKKMTACHGGRCLGILTLFIQQLHFHPL